MSKWLLKVKNHFLERCKHKLLNPTVLVVMCKDNKTKSLQHCSQLCKANSAMSMPRGSSGKRWFSLSYFRSRKFGIMTNPILFLEHEYDHIWMRRSSWGRRDCYTTTLIGSGCELKDNHNPEVATLCFIDCFTVNGTLIY